MRLWTFFLLVLGAAALAAIGWVFWRATSDQREWREILSHEGKDLHRLEKPELVRLYQLLRSRIPSRDWELSSMAPWGLHRLVPRDRVLLLDAPTVISIPGDFPVVAHVFSSDGRPLTITSFSGGWRMIWVSTRVMPAGPAGASCIVAESKSSLSGENVGRQYYGLLKDRVVLLRLEDEQGAFVPNSYWTSNLRIGPEPPDRAPDLWEDSLHAQDPSEVLASLCWLAGEHWHAEGIRESHHETAEACRQVADVRKRAGVKARLKVLENSTNSWIAEAARAASSTCPK